MRGVALTGLDRENISLGIVEGLSGPQIAARLGRGVGDVPAAVEAVRAGAGGAELAIWLATCPAVVVSRVAQVIRSAAGPCLPR